MHREFDSKSLPNAVKALLELNNYIVRGPEQVHGAEIDLIARHKSDPFASALYIEATIEYVDNDKYGKDVGKLALIREKDPDGRRIIVSSRGFSLPVKERAQESRIQTFTYDELFAKFERFEPYVTSCSSGSVRGNELDTLASVYEEPYFDDPQGKDLATEFLTSWRDRSSSKDRWLVVTGEYGTGKTALTKILQYRWLQDYRVNPSLPIPFRVELRDFTRQFDARGLLHHFLDHNSLGHIPVDFVYALLRSGRVVLLLDGYDEMAQYLHARERRSCLAALAELSAGGAKGILTSRPNYFTETEEFHVFEVLYKSIDQERYFLTRKDRELIEEEAQIDQLLERFLDRHERSLKDLTPQQTEALVARVLHDDVIGREIVLNLLKRIFRTTAEGEAVSLSGKPVIISYLLEVVEGLKESERNRERTKVADLSEWDIFKMIVDQLMLRDLRRSPEILPDIRRQFLARLSVRLSQKDHAVIIEEDFKDLIAKEFQRELRRHAADQKTDQIERYFADLRSSATLTRSADPNRPGWVFSHNSLREFLAAEYLLKGLAGTNIIKEHIPVSDAMRLFVSSRTESEKRKLLVDLGKIWRGRPTEFGYGQTLTLIWDACVPLFKFEEDPTRRLLSELCGGTTDLERIEIDRISFSNQNTRARLDHASFRGSTLLSVELSNCELVGANFTETFLDAVTFSESNLDGATFTGACLIDVDFSGTSVNGSDFANIIAEEVVILIDAADVPRGKLRLEGLNALGYLNYCGAKTDSLPDFYIIKHHPRFDIVEKIVEKLRESSLRQRRGLEQRGAARQDITFARDFVRFLEMKGLVRTPKNRKDLVEVTENGREVFGLFFEKKNVPKEISEYLRAH